MNIVIDTNVLLQIIFPEFANYRVWEDFIRGKFTLFYTTEILYEYEEIITKFTESNTFAKYIVNVILASPYAREVSVSYKFNLITKDPDDNKFVDCAIVANAHYLVTNDKHFNVLKKIDFPKVDCISLASFKKLLTQQDNA